MRRKQESFPSTSLLIPSFFLSSHCKQYWLLELKNFVPSSNILARAAPTYHCFTCTQYTFYAQISLEFNKIFCVSLFHCQYYKTNYHRRLFCKDTTSLSLVLFVHDWVWICGGTVIIFFSSLQKAFFLIKALPTLQIKWPPCVALFCVTWEASQIIYVHTDFLYNGWKKSVAKKEINESILNCFYNNF